MSAVLRKPKTFKMRSLHSEKRFGVAGRSYEEVLRKGCQHLQVLLGPPGGSLHLQDGTLLTRRPVASGLPELRLPRATQ